MLHQRSEEIIQVKKEIISILELKTPYSFLTTKFEEYRKENDPFTRGKAFVVQSKMERVDDLLKDCEHNFHFNEAAENQKRRLEQELGNNYDYENDLYQSNDNDDSTSSDEYEIESSQDGSNIKSSTSSDESEINDHGTNNK